MGILVSGSELFGAVDKVPGFFHVATKFTHAYFVPLVPLRTYVVVQGGGPAPHYIPIRMSVKSVLIAWFRGTCAVTAAVALCGAIMVSHLDERPHAWFAPAAFVPAGVTLYALTHLVGGLTRASFGRAMAIGRMAGFSEWQLATIAAAFGRATPPGPE